MVRVKLKSSALATTNRKSTSNILCLSVYTLLPYNLSASLEVGGEHRQALYLDTVIFKGQVSGQA